MKTNFCADAQPPDSQNHVPCHLEGSAPWVGVELGPAARRPLTALLPLSSLGAIPAPCGWLRRTRLQGTPELLLQRPNWTPNKGCVYE